MLDMNKLKEIRVPFTLSSYQSSQIASHKSFLAVVKQCRVKILWNATKQFFHDEQFGLRYSVVLTI